MKKEELTIKIVNNFIKCVFGYDDLESALGKSFSKETFRENDSIQKYMDMDMSCILRKYMLVKKCTKISEKKKMIDEQDLLTIVRAVVREFGYKTVGMGDGNGLIKERLYYIVPVGKNILNLI